MTPAPRSHHLTKGMTHPAPHAAAVAGQVVEVKVIPAPLHLAWGHTLIVHNLLTSQAVAPTHQMT